MKRSAVGSTEPSLVMASADKQEIRFDGIDVIVLDKWKVKIGTRIGQSGHLLFTYRKCGDSSLEPTGEPLKYKCKRDGIIVNGLMKKEGDVILPNDAIIEFTECLHNTVMKDLCADCGANINNLDDSQRRRIAESTSISMVHSVPELRVSKERAETLGRADELRLLKDRKLVLLVDLDQTLIHSTNHNVPHDMPDVHHFQLYGPHTQWYHTKFRPHTMDFLKTMSKIFELHICTFGARRYAHAIANLMDPKEQYFPKDRILSRDECLDSNLKTANMKSLFPCGDSMVCIIDDREDVWNFSPNLIAVKPYLCFKDTGDINAPEIPLNNVFGGSITDMTNKAAILDEFTKDEKKVNKNDHDERSDTETYESHQLSIERSKSEEEKIKTKEPDITEIAETVETQETTKTSETSKMTEKTEIVETIKEVEVNIEIEETMKNRDKTETEETGKMEEETEIAKTIETAGVTKTAETEEIAKTTETAEGEAKDSIDARNVEVSKTEAIKENEYSEDKNDTNDGSANEAGNLSSAEASPQTKEIESNDSSDFDSVNKPEAPPKPKTSESKKENPTKEHVLEDNDDYLLYLEEILTRIHSEYYREYDEKMKYKSDCEEIKIPDLKEVIPRVRKSVLRGVNIVFSGVIPTNIPPEKNKLYNMGKSLGANITHDLVINGSPKTTHLVAAKWGTVKVNKAVKAKNVWLVNPNWLICCGERWERVDELLFPLGKDVVSEKERPVISKVNDSKTSVVSPKSSIAVKPPSSASYATYDPKTGKRVRPQSQVRATDQKSEPIAQGSHQAQNQQAFSDKDIQPHNMLEFSPLSGFSSNDLQSMGKEVDDACSEGDELSTGNTDSEGDSDIEVGNDKDKKCTDKRRFDSSSEESDNGGEFPKGWNKNKKSKGDQRRGLLPELDEVNDSTKDSFDFDSRRPIGEDYESTDNESIGSVDEEMALAIEREFLS